MRKLVLILFLVIGFCLFKEDLILNLYFFCDGFCGAGDKFALEGINYFCYCLGGVLR